MIQLDAKLVEELRKKETDNNYDCYGAVSD